MLPFTREQFLSVFVAYNEAIWPLQVVAYLIGVVAVALLFRPGQITDRIVSGILAVMWLWTGIVYHAVFFAPINRAAYVFAVLFLLQGIGLLLAGMLRARLHFGFRSDASAWVGGAFVIYAALFYPLVGVWTGHTYPEMPIFGVTPCPVTIFTLGMFLLTTRPVSPLWLVVPFLWSLIGGSAAILLDVPQDWPLLVSGLIAVGLIVGRNRRLTMVPRQSRTD